MASFDDIIAQQGEYDWLEFPYWAEAVQHGNKFHNFVAWLADTDAYLCAVVINRKAEFLVVLAQIRSEMSGMQAVPESVPHKAPLPEHWIKLVDPTTETPFYYHMVSGKSQWEFPISQQEIHSPRAIDAFPEYDEEFGTTKRTTRSRKPLCSARPPVRDPLVKDPRRKLKAPKDILNYPAGAYRDQQAVHVHRY